MWVPPPAARRPAHGRVAHRALRLPSPLVRLESEPSGLL